jgi:dihydroneopterin aldolase
MDKLFITGLLVTTTIGTLAFERQIKQTIILDLEWSVPEGWHLQDELKNTLDYTEVASTISEYVPSLQCRLIETLAEQIAQLLLTRFTIDWLRLTIRKAGAVANAKEVGIVIERENSHYAAK